MSTARCTQSSRAPAPGCGCEPKTRVNETLVNEVVVDETPENDTPADGTWVNVTPADDTPVNATHVIGTSPNATHVTETSDRISVSPPTPAVPESPLLADHTTFRVGGRARHFVTARTEDELIDAVRAADEAGEPLLVLSGGSNLLVGDADFAGTVVHVTTRGLSADVSACGGAVVSVQAGETWDDLVAYAISQEWSGAEAMSGIPGLVGATPIQNVGAYGAEVSQVVYRVRTWDRLRGSYATFANADADFGYR